MLFLPLLDPVTRSSCTCLGSACPPVLGQNKSYIFLSSSFFLLLPFPIIYGSTLSLHTLLYSSPNSHRYHKRQSSSSLSRRCRLFACKAHLLVSRPRWLGCFARVPIQLVSLTLQHQNLSFRGDFGPLIEDHGASAVQYS